MYSNVQTGIRIMNSEWSTILNHKSFAVLVKTFIYICVNLRHLSRFNACQNCQIIHYNFSTFFCFWVSLNIKGFLDAFYANSLALIRSAKRRRVLPLCFCTARKVYLFLIWQCKIPWERSVTLCPPWRDLNHKRGGVFTAG